MVASAKKEYWKEQVEAIISLYIFKVVQWASTRASKILPPLIFEERIISDQIERAEMF